LPEFTEGDLLIENERRTSACAAPHREPQHAQRTPRHDDANLHLSIVCQIATQVGFTTTGAATVSDAARLLRERSFDCITLDLSLGEQPGVDILKLLAPRRCSCSAEHVR
jgi:ActR/RegA family two-component response regulator